MRVASRFKPRSVAVEVEEGKAEGGAGGRRSRQVKGRRRSKARAGETEGGLQTGGEAKTEESGKVRVGKERRRNKAGRAVQAEGEDKARGEGKAEVEVQSRGEGK